ncbi:Pentatricopeptide repeat-containing protein 1, mitochondrial [Halocaridina rubra]|uniref:Pentatricopeptide repeat-containing protein 1, mitochondrial n=1 Tax=Halocaridina rubra TaxID=373956 RepID=A0AAN8XDG6_HALRR
MLTLKSKLGRCQLIWPVASALGNISRYMPISLSTFDSSEKEHVAFGLLESDPHSEFYETGRGKNQKSYSKKTHYRRKIHSSQHKPQLLSELHQPYVQTQALDTWTKLKADDMHRLSKNFVQDDNEEEYLKYLSGRSKYQNKKLEVGKYENKKVTAVDSASMFETPEEDRLFGTLSPQKDLYEDEEGDEGDLRQERYEAAKVERRHRPAYYGFRMKQLCKEKKLVEALQILEEEMPAAAVKPDHFCYQVLINACGRGGYTKKAFRLYNDMKKRGLEVQPVAYTGLFNACAESPWPTTDGLKRAHKLRDQLIEKGYIFNQIISHAMIKAFGRCGDIKTAFNIVDEMLEQGLIVTTETINFMLQACVTDKETGFRHALLVWRKMRELRLLPDIYSYNLLVRCIASCNAGDPALTTQLLEGASTNERNIDIKNGKMVNKIEEQYVDSPKKVEDACVKREEKPAAIFAENETENPMTTNVEVLEHNHKLLGVRMETSVVHLLPNLLGPKIKKGSVIGIGSLTQPEDRLVLLGGPVGLMTQMAKDKVTPNLTTVTQLVDSLPPNIEAEESLIQSMKNIGLAPDTQFCNKLIRKRMFRFDSQSARGVLDLMQEYHLLPDIITFGCLALGARSLNYATELLNDMENAGFRPNLEIFSILVKNSIWKENYFFTLEMMREMRKNDISPDENLLTLLEKTRVKAKQQMHYMESGKVDSTPEERKKYQDIKLFLIEYKKWLKTSNIQPEDHPWTQYRYSNTKA